MNLFSSVLKQTGLSDIQDRLRKFPSMDETMNSHPELRELRERYPTYSFPSGDIIGFITAKKNCEQCPGLESCPNMIYGHSVIVDEEGPHFRHVKCDKMLLAEKHKELQRRIQCHHVPEGVLEMTFENIDPDGGRVKAIKAAMSFCNAYKEGVTKIGLYLHGGFGVGKSVICGAIARRLAQKNIDVVMVYVPDFLQEMKAAIRTGSVDEKINSMKNVPVLILDDIGAEPLTEWTRDEVLGAILQARMNKLPTIFTSNLTIEELTEHLANTKERNIKKAERIMERIEPFVDVYTIIGPNRRRKRREENAG